VLPLFFVRHLHRTNLRLEQANRDLLELMVKSIEARDPYTSGHSVRVALYAKALARAMGLPAKEVDQIETAALLHDVGKIYEEFAPILRKDGRLTDEEFGLMRTHPLRSAELVGTISALRGYVQNCVRAHHENFDGGGYPAGLAGEEIPVGARIIMVADTADAMMTDRPYRKALTYDNVVTEFDKYAGAQFDPTVVRAFMASTAIRRLVDQRDRIAQTDLAEPRERIRELAGS
jgi:putative nucleotidyltransferase with HDIG domain